MQRLALAAAALLLAAGCGKAHTTFPTPGPLQAGVGVEKIPAPIGIGTAGFGPFMAPQSPSPFSDLYPGTTRLHGHPTFKAVVLSRGPGNEIIFVRSDTVGVFQQLRRAVALEVGKRLGRDVDDALIMGGTHTHSGPGRLLDGGDVLNLLTDKFLPEYYQNFVDAAVTAVMDAYGDLQPAEVGTTTAMLNGDHYDRRCEDGPDHTNDRMPIIAVRRNGQIDALVLAYAMHGTVLGIDQLTLSEDASGALEQGIEASFDHPVMTMFFNSWGADMAPGMPDVSGVAASTQPDGYVRMLKIGQLASDAVQGALASVTWDDTPVLFSEVHRVPINREVIGYAKDEFPFEWGGAFCNGDPSLDDCDPSTQVPDLDKMCIAFPEEEPAPAQTEFAAGRVGNLHFLTFPGESTTSLIEKLMSDLKSDFGDDDVMLFGYTMDYIGYSLLEADWWNGGYEASGSIWGPKQGEYLMGRAHDVYKAVLVDGRGGGPLGDEPKPLDPFAIPMFTPYAPATAMQLGTIATDVSATYAAMDVITLTVNGSDPWLGTPVARLQDAMGNDVLRKNGQPITSDGYAFWVDLAPTPSYKDAATAPARTFAWTFSLPATLGVDGAAPMTLSGHSYKLHVTVPAASGDMSVDSQVFMVE